MRKRWLIWGVVALVVIAAVGGYYYYSTTKAKAAASAKKATLQTTTARTGDIALMASGTGQIIPATQAGLGFSQSGTLMEMDVKVGDLVKAGDVLAKAQTSNTPDSIAAAIADAQNQVLKAQQALDNLYLNASTLKVTALNNVTTYAQAVRNAQYNLDYFVVSPEMAKMTPLEGFDWAEQQLNKARAAWDPYKFYPSSDPTRTQLLTDLSNWQSTYDSALKRLNYEYALESAQASLDKARKDYDTYKDGPSAADVASAQSDLDNAKAKLAVAQDTKAVVEIVAPTDGTVMTIANNIGEAVGTSPVITLATMTSPLLQIYLDETDLEKAKVGNAAEVTFDALPGKTFTGKVIQVNPGLEAVSNVQAIKLLVQLDPLPADGPQTLPVGLDAAADIISAQAKNAVLVPLQALKQLDTNEYAVFVDNNGVLTLRVVQVGLQDVTYAQILSGLKVGDVVTTGITATR